MSSLSISGNTDWKRNSEKEKDSEQQQQQQQRPESRYADVKFVMGYLKKTEQLLRKCIQVLVCERPIAARSHVKSGAR